MQQKMYRYKIGSPDKGSIRALKPHTNPDEYIARLNAKGETAIKVKQPTIQTLTKWDNEGYCKSVDGCHIEPDGYCEHGFPSWLIALGMI